MALATTVHSLIPFQVLLLFLDQFSNIHILANILIVSKEVHFQDLILPNYHGPEGIYWQFPSSFIQ